MSDFPCFKSVLGFGAIIKSRINVKVWYFLENFRKSQIVIVCQYLLYFYHFSSLIPFSSESFVKKSEYKNLIYSVI